MYWLIENHFYHLKIPIDRWSDLVLSCKGSTIKFPFFLISPIDVETDQNNADKKHWLNIPIFRSVFLREDNLVLIQKLRLISNLELFLQLNRFCWIGDALVVASPCVTIVIEKAQWTCQGFVYLYHLSLLWSTINYL